MQELKLLLKLEADAPINPRLLDEDVQLDGTAFQQPMGGADTSMDELRRKRKPS